MLDECRDRASNLAWTEANGPFLPRYPLDPRAFVKWTLAGGKSDFLSVRDRRKRHHRF